MVCKKWTDFEICNLREMCFHDQKCPKAKSGHFGSQKSYGHKKWTLFFGNESIMLSSGFSWVFFQIEKFIFKNGQIFVQFSFVFFQFEIFFISQNRTLKIGLQMFFAR